MEFDDGMRSYRTNKPFEGVIPNLARRYRETDSSWTREELEKYRANQPCDVCGGKRLKAEALAVKIDNCDISDVARLSIADARQWFADLAAKLHGQDLKLPPASSKKSTNGLDFWSMLAWAIWRCRVILAHCRVEESQRIRLASQIGSGLTGVLYVLDEPSIGLHQRDNDRLLATLVRLRDLGNTVLVVEHDEEAILLADYVVDMGPGAGVHGGTVVAAGTPAEIMANNQSLTGQYLSGTLEIAVPKTRRKAQKKAALSVSKTPMAITCKM